MKAILAGVVLSLVIPSHDAMHLSDWIQRDGLTDPTTKQSCCGPSDCQALGPEAVKEFQGGYIINSTGEWIEYARVIWRSRDGQWWVCRPGENGDKMRGPIRCIIAPPNGA